MWLIGIVHHLTEARDIFQTIASRPDYVDLHAWRFTPSSFELLLLELAWLGILDWRAERITPSVGANFTLGYGLARRRRLLHSAPASGALASRH
jgi:hypothetical protein